MQQKDVADSLPSLTPFDPATMIQSLDERGRGLRVVFFRPAAAADRWGHVVATVLDAGKPEETVVPRLVSQEGAGPDDWPLSPPLQSLAIEERAEGAVALLVGMSGQSHWSASFEMRPGLRLVVDIACRLGSGAGEWRLGTTYLVNVPLTVTESPGRLAVDSTSEARLLIEFGPEIEAKLTSGGVVLGVHDTTARPIRWKYEMACG